LPQRNGIGANHYFRQADYGKPHIFHPLVLRSFLNGNQRQARALEGKAFTRPQERIAGVSSLRDPYRSGAAHHCLACVDIQL
jgi:hypothetical protein